MNTPTNMTELKTHVEALIRKSAQAEKSEDAMRLAQAALNAANAICSLQVKFDDKE